MSEPVILTAIAGIILAMISNGIGFRAGRDEGFFDGRKRGYRDGHRNGWIAGCLEGAKRHAFATKDFCTDVQEGGKSSCDSLAGAQEASIHPQESAE